MNYAANVYILYVYYSQDAPGSPSKCLPSQCKKRVPPLDATASVILSYVSLGLVVLWTARFAWAKGRNPWIWGGATVLFALVLKGMDFRLWQLAAMAPMVMLLFLGSRASQGETPAHPAGVTCPKCQTRHLATQHYCVNCGWDLAKPYETPAANGASAPAPPAAADLSGERKEAKPVMAASQIPAEAAPAAAAPPAPAPEQPQPAPKPPRVHRPPTAVGMTERGLALFGQGKIQEAVDQFTKAIALDPSYLDAFQRRAEAYQRLGRPKEAAEDMRRLQTLDGSVQ